MTSTTTISDFFDVANISLNDLKEIFNASSKPAKRMILLKKLGVEYISEETELRKSIIVDFCLELIIFASNEGFSWQSIQTMLVFLLNLLEETSCKGLDSDEAIKVFKSKLLEIQKILSQDELRKLIDYILKTFFCHYKLYLFCMTNEQDIDQRHELLEIEAPIMPEALSNGTDFEKWKYQQAIAQIEDEKNGLQTLRDEKHATTVEKIDQEKDKAMQDLDNAYETMNAEDLPKILEALTKLHVQYIDSEIQKSLEESKDKTEYTMKRGGVVNPDSAKLRPTSRNRPKSKQKK